MNSLNDNWENSIENLLDWKNWNGTGMGDYCVHCPHFRIKMEYDDILEDAVVAPLSILTKIGGICNKIFFMEYYGHESSYEGMINESKEKLFLDAPVEKIKECKVRPYEEYKYNEVPEYFRKDVERYVRSHNCPMICDKKCEMYTERTVNKLNE